MPLDLRITTSDTQAAFGVGSTNNSSSLLVCDRITTGLTPGVTTSGILAH